MTSDVRQTPAAGEAAPAAAHATPIAPRAIRRILVPLDGSPQSERALDHAGRVARRAGATLLLAHVREADDAGFGVETDYPARVARDPALAGAGPAETVVLEGPPTDALLAYAARAEADLIVMTSRGRGGVRRALLGSVADQLVRRADVPVLLVRGAAEPAEDDARPLRVLLPLDGSADAETILPVALAVAGGEDARYELLRVQPPSVAGRIPLATLTRRRQAARDGDPYLATVAGRLGRPGARAGTTALVGPAPADVVLRHAVETGADLIAMTTRGMGGVDRMVFGSVADAVVRGAPCPVLVLRPPAG